MIRWYSPHSPLRVDEANLLAVLYMQAVGYQYNVCLMICFPWTHGVMVTCHYSQTLTLGVAGSILAVSCPFFMSCDVSARRRWDAASYQVRGGRTEVPYEVPVRR